MSSIPAPPESLPILVMNGPNLNRLGKREPEVYGTRTLDELMEVVSWHARSRGAAIEVFTSNHEGALIDVLHAAPGMFRGIVFNPGAYTHYSYALRDAVASLDVPVVEVHLSDISQREEFRRTSVIAPECLAQFSGGGSASYIQGVDAILEATSG